ncbi:hypothetical protein L915_06478 [Phytophthora nicotianae]|uniref:BZIP domain-containing protein n=2 Tax=Phytophthora nicotianae TaxID=4792 RepID=W2H4S7_PHYNI|nr:hypothetical protein L915_06478 [Phytophthora nicotianae]ETO78313.1 hypothetical protein F444_06676 [Phytophthora nicotianae P1976]
MTDEEQNLMEAMTMAESLRKYEYEGENPTADRRRKIKNAQEAKRQVRYLKKLKVERRTLQKQEVELALQLKKLWNAHDQDRTARNKKMLALGAWKMTALRQKAPTEPALATCVWHSKESFLNGKEAILNQEPHPELQRRLST